MESYYIKQLFCEYFFIGAFRGVTDLLETTVDKKLRESLDTVFPPPSIFRYDKILPSHSLLTPIFLYSCTCNKNLLSLLSKTVKAALAGQK